MRSRLIWLSVVAGLLALLIYVFKMQGLWPGRPVLVEVVKQTPLQRRAPSPGMLSFAEAVQSAAPAVVNIASTKVIAVQSNPLFQDPAFRRFFGDAFPSAPRKRLSRSLGSGVIVSADGYVLTNHHVAGNAQEIEVGLRDGRTVPAKVVGSDPESDLAVLKIDLTGLSHIVMGEAKDLQIGDIVLAIGNPFSVGQTVTMGIVSALGRSHLGINAFENFIQTDAAINPGNSGGALVDVHGRLVGINTAIYSRDGGSMGIGFAIPVDLVTKVMKQLIEKGHVTRGWLGVGTQDLDAAIAKSLGLKSDQGVLVTTVMPGSPADAIHLRAGDVLTQINGEKLRDAKALLDYIAAISPGAVVPINYVRAGREWQSMVKVGTRPVPMDTEQASQELPYDGFGEGH